MIDDNHQPVGVSNKALTPTKNCGKIQVKTPVCVDRPNLTPSRCLRGVVHKAATTYRIRSRAGEQAEIDAENERTARFHDWLKAFLLTREAKGVATYGHTIDKARIEDLEDGVEEELGDALMYAQKDYEKLWDNGQHFAATSWETEVIRPLIRVLRSVWALRGN